MTKTTKNAWLGVLVQAFPDVFQASLVYTSKFWASWGYIVRPVSKQTDLRGGVAGSVGIGACCRAFQPEFDAHDPQGRKSGLISTVILCVTFPHKTNKKCKTCKGIGQNN